MAMNEVCHIEWNVTDLAKSQKFYEAMFGWKFQGFMDDMVTFGTGDKHVGGLLKTDTVVPGASPSVWLEVPDVDAYLEKAPKVGGARGCEKSAVPHVGWSATICDPDGNQVGLVQFDRS